MTRRRIALAAALALAAGCADFEAPPVPAAPDVLVATPSFARDVAPIFAATCATVSCHNRATHQLDLVLTADTAWTELVDQTSLFYPGLYLVRPFKPDSSWVLNVIREDSLLRFGHPRMPLGRAPLSERQIATIVHWIEQGAKRD